MTADDPIWDDPFHAAAWQAFVEGVAETGGIPDSRATRQRAYAIYEATLSEQTKGSAPCDSPG